MLSAKCQPFSSDLNVLNEWHDDDISWALFPHYCSSVQWIQHAGALTVHWDIDAKFKQFIFQKSKLPVE